MNTAWPWFFVRNGIFAMHSKNFLKYFFFEKHWHESKFHEIVGWAFTVIITGIDLSIFYDIKKNGNFEKRVLLFHKLLSWFIEIMCYDNTHLSMTWFNETYGCDDNTTQQEHKTSAFSIWRLRDVYSKKKITKIWIFEDNTTVTIRLILCYLSINKYTREKLNINCTITL